MRVQNLPGFIVEISFKKASRISVGFFVDVCGMNRKTRLCKEFKSVLPFVTGMISDYDVFWDNHIFHTDVYRLV